MRSLIWIVMTTSLWAGVIMGQKECVVDTDCTGNQYCYKPSLLCVNYTVCGHYNRKESSKPSHEAIDCGKCLEGYSEVEPTLEQSSIRTESCTRVENPDKNNTISKWQIVASIVFVIAFAIGFLYVVHILIRCKNPCGEPAAVELEQPCSLMIVNNSCPSAPPAPSSNQNMNNNKYHNREEKKLLSTIGEHHDNIIVEKNRTVQAQGYHPPNYVWTDPSYNPGDTQTGQPTFSPSDIDEETIPSEWVPGPTTGGTIPLQPFAAIAEVQDNTTNSVLQRLTCPSPPPSQEGHGNRQNGSSGNSGGFSYGNSNGNASHGNTNSGAFMQVHQTVNVINRWNNGS